jgi:glycosyltransferase involved in cell wall biosynthesis
MPLPRVLRIFGRYQHYGGEEAVARRIQTELADVMDADWFESSTDEFLGKSFTSRLTAVFAAVHNAPVFRQLKKAQERNGYVVWEIHNVFPALSPSVYAAAFELGVPIIHFLHNYRLACVNGQFLNHGIPCTRCISGNFLPAVQTVCWRDSRIACAVMGLTLTRVRQLKVFERVAAWVTLSEAQKQLHLKMGLPEQRLHVIPHFLNVEPEQPPPICEDGYALFLGRLSPEKGVQQLLRAWQNVRSSNARLVIAGTGPDEPRLRALARDLNLTNVEFRGFVDRSRHGDLWAKSKFLIVPSIWHEPFPLVVLEAMAQGRPLVVSNFGSLSETVGEAGLVADPFKSKELATACDKFLSGRDLADQKGKLAVGRLKQHFHRRIWMERIKQVYQCCGVNLPLS